MYCSNCGNELDPKAAFCVHCGVRTMDGTKFCRNCGAETVPGGNVCIQCGALLTSAAKSKLAAGLFGIFLGCFGVHNFYLGFTGKAIAQLLITVLTCGIGAAVSSIWGLIEGILILTDPCPVDASGVPLRQ